MNIKVNGKEYNLEYAFEAAMDKKCVDMCWNYFSGAYMMKDQVIDDVGSEEVSKVMTVDKMIEGMADMPRISMYLFYAGLLENHSDEIHSEAEAKNLFKEFRKEYREDERSTFSGMLNAIRIQMEEDGFFGDIGLQEFLDQMEAPGVQKTAKIPQDHKKKATNPSAK